MRVFITGATGFIGSAITAQLIEAGHQVLGLARNDHAATTLEGWGAEVFRGDATDDACLDAGARASDGVIHLAYDHDFSRYPLAVEKDRRAVGALIDALEGTGKPLVIASGTLMVAHARPAAETDAPASPDVPRARSEMLVMEAADRGVRGSVVRLAPSVHGREKQGLVTQMIAAAREKGLSPFVGDGQNRWPAVHRLDAARLFVLALEKAEPGSRLHAAAEEGIPMHEIAEAIGEGLGVPVRSVAGEEASAHFGLFAGFVGLDNPTSSAITRETLGWRPQEPGLLAGLREGGYRD